MTGKAGLIILGIGMLTGCDSSDDPGAAADMQAVDQGARADMRDVDQGQTPDMAIDGGAAALCPEAWSGRPAEVSPSAQCQPLDIFDGDSCTAAQQGVICEQSAICDPPFEDPGNVVACCDGARWVRLEEEPDLCGLPVGDMGAPDPVDPGVDAGAPADP